MSICLRKVVVGTELTITTVVDGTRCDFEKIIRTVKKSNPSAASRIMDTMKVAAEYGCEALDDRKFKALGSGLYEFKEHNAGFRLFWFYDKPRKNLVIICKTWLKAGNVELQSSAIKEARKRMSELKSLTGIPFEQEETQP